MEYTTYELEGKTKDKVISIFDEKDKKMNERKQYCATIGALEHDVVCKGPNVDGFIFENQDNKPNRWVWYGTVYAEGETIGYARPQRRSKADKEEWIKINALKDNTREKLNKLFYNDAWGFSSGNEFKRYGVGGFIKGDRAFAEIATDAETLPGMKEILRSEYNNIKST